MRFETLELARKIVKDAFMHIDKLDKYDPLRNQASRSAISVVSNLAEGNQRRGKDRRQLFLVAKGSLAELHEQLMIIDYLNSKSNDWEDIEILHKMIYKLVEACDK